MTLDHAARQIGATVAMAFDREGWRERLERSLDAVFASFTAFLIAAPLTLIGALGVRRAFARAPEAEASLLAEAPLAVALGAQLVGFGLDWAASLAALVFASRHLGAAKRAGDIVIGFNWAQPPIAATQAAYFSALAFGVGGPAAALLAVPAVVFVIALLWGVIRRTMDLKPGPATLMLLTLLLIGAVVNALVSALATAVYGGGS